MHLFPADAIYSGAGAPLWFREPIERRSGAGRRSMLIAWDQTGSDLMGLSAYDGLVAVNCRRLTDQQLREAGFPYVRRFAVVPSFNEARWFIPLDAPAVSSAAFALYTPVRHVARLKLWGARAAIRARVPLWYRDRICIAQRSTPPLETALQALFPDQPVRLALSSGALGPDLRRKPSVAVLSLRGGNLAFAKLSGSRVARDLVAHEAKVLLALAALPGPDRVAPRLLFAGEVDGTSMVVQTPINGRPVGTELTPAHERFLEVLRSSERPSAASAGIIASARRQAWSLPTPRTDLLAILDEIMPLLRRLPVPSTITHTDFVPWNLRQDRGAIAAFDWDTAELDGLPLYDEVHHLMVVGLLVHRWTTGRAFDCLQRFASSAPLGLRPEHARALQAVYFIHSILRFLVQGHSGDDPVVRWYREVLCRLHPPATGRHGKSPLSGGLRR
jgi:hypothetical protein